MRGSGDDRAAGATTTANIGNGAAHEGLLQTAEPSGEEM
jgi:hypothetical protein